MSDPVAPAKFAHPDDVRERFSEAGGGEYTADDDWAQLRIEDVEAILIGLVPSLAVPIAEIDATRLRRVKVLVADKVLQLHREIVNNPGGANSIRQEMDGVSEQWSYAANVGAGGSLISFTEDELDWVRLLRKRARFATIPVDRPWWATTC